MTPKRGVLHGNTCRAAIFLTLGCVLAAGFGPHRVAAVSIEGVEFADSIEVDGIRLTADCAGLMRYLIFIKAYVAALYTGPGVAPEQVLTDVPKRLELEYFHAISGEDFGPAQNQILRRNVSAEVFEELKPKADQLAALYEDVKPGDRYSLTYIPGKGTELALNGAPKGRIDGAAFASAVFSVWLGKEPIDDSLRDQLLGCRKK